MLKLCHKSLMENSNKINYLKRASEWCKLVIIFYESIPEWSDENSIHSRLYRYLN